MPTLYQLIPDVEVLLALTPADLAPLLLKLARGSLQPGGFLPEDVTFVCVSRAATRPL